MKTIKVKHARICCFDGCNRMILATILAPSHNIKREVAEWIDDTNHVNRDDSSIIDNDELIELNKTELNEVFTELDHCLEEIQKSENDQSSYVRKLMDYLFK